MQCLHLIFVMGLAIVSAVQLLLRVQGELNATAFEDDGKLFQLANVPGWAQVKHKAWNTLLSTLIAEEGSHSPLQPKQLLGLGVGEEDGVDAGDGDGGTEGLCGLATAGGCDGT
jgi:hypothetical protein